MPTQEQLIRLLDASAHTSKLKFIFYDASRSPTQPGYRPIITEALIASIREQIAKTNGGTLTDIIARLEDYVPIDGVDFRGIPASQEQHLRDHLHRFPNLNPMVRTFPRLLIGVVRENEDSPYDILDANRIWLGLY